MTKPILTVSNLKLIALIRTNAFFMDVEFKGHNNSWFQNLKFEVFNEKQNYQAW